MTPDEIRELMEEVNDEALNMDGFEQAVVGIMERFGISPVFLYNWQKCIDILIESGCENREEAEEYLHFNCLGAWMGDGTPSFTNMYGEMEHEEIAPVNV